MKELRKKLNMTQVDFAKVLGVTNAHISKIEKGGTVPSDALIKLICKEYDVNEHWLKDGIDPMFMDFDTDVGEIVTKSLSIYNKLLTSNSESVRELGAQIQYDLGRIVDPGSLDDNQIVQYLNILHEMLSTIDLYNTYIKDSLESRQLTFKNILNLRIEDYKVSICNTIDKYKSLINY
jgi:transcriptional regulator with XRE-family HTH domain